MKFSSFQSLLVSQGHRVRSEFVLTFFNEKETWHGAKSKCEHLGQRLAVLDTLDKRTAIASQM